MYRHLKQFEIRTVRIKDDMKTKLVFFIKQTFNIPVYLVSYLFHGQEALASILLSDLKEPRKTNMKCYHSTHRNTPNMVMVH